MVTSVLGENARKHILFDVLDGVPPTENESEDAIIFRKEIESDNRSLEYRAEELGLDNVLVEFTSGCEI